MNMSVPIKRRLFNSRLLIAGTDIHSELLQCSERKSFSTYLHILPTSRTCVFRILRR